MVLFLQNDLMIRVQPFHLITSLLLFFHFNCLLSSIPPSQKDQLLHHLPLAPLSFKSQCDFFDEPLSPSLFATFSLFLFQLFKFKQTN